MSNVLFVGLDVDDNAFHLAGICQQTGEILQNKTKPQLAALIKQLSVWRDRGFELRICYEATYVGFALYRDLKEAKFESEVIAPSLIPEIKGPKVKTDRLDSRKLAEHYMKGSLTPIYVPSLEDEATRDLTRSRAFLVDQLKAIKQHVIATMRRMGLNYKHENPKSEYWSKRHRTWISKQIALTSMAPLKANLSNLLCVLSSLESQLCCYEDEIEVYAESEKYKPQAQALMSYRGISSITAMTLITELGDINRFPHPKQLVSYAGLDLSEYSSGGHQRRYHITKAGNRFIRKALVESAQCCGNPPRISKSLMKRRQNVKPENIAVADRCMKRLYRKASLLRRREKPANKIKVACARETLGFIWESLRLVS